MKYLFTVIISATIYNVHSQDLDIEYYLFGFSFDYSVPTYTGRKLEKQKINPWIHEGDTGKVLRLSEVTSKEVKKRKPIKGCRNCDEFYELKAIPWQLSDFYTFTNVKEKGTRPKKAIGAVKDEVIDKATDQQMESFLAGIYNGYGSMIGDTIKFQFGHVEDKLKITEKFIHSLEGATFIQTIPAETGSIGGGPQLLFVPKGTLKEILLNERDRINKLAKKTYKQ